MSKKGNNTEDTWLYFGAAAWIVLSFMLAEPVFGGHIFLAIFVTAFAILLILGLTTLILMHTPKQKLLREQHEQKNRNEAKKEEEAAKRREHADFYALCLSKGITNPSSRPEQMRDLEILGANCGYTSKEETLSAYSEGKIADTVLKAQAEEARLLELGKREKETCEEQKTRAQRVGKSKYLAEAKKEIETHEASIRLTKNVASQLAQSAYSPAEKEDWAFAGGMATGIAGGAAGLAVASEIQSRNAQRELEKEQERATLHDRTRGFYETAFTLQKQIDELRPKVEEIESRLIDETHTDDLFELLDVSVERTEVTEAGNLKVRIHAACREQPTLLSSPAVLDGSLYIAVLNKAENQEVLGWSYCCAPGFDKLDLSKAGFPVKGTPFRRISYEAIVCPSRREEFSASEDYVVQVLPHRLWLIELGEAEKERYKLLKELPELRRMSSPSLREAEDSILTPELVEWAKRHGKPFSVADAREALDGMGLEIGLNGPIFEFRAHSIITRGIREGKLESNTFTKTHVNENGKTVSVDRTYQVVGFDWSKYQE